MQSLDLTLRRGGADFLHEIGLIAAILLLSLSAADLITFRTAPGQWYVSTVPNFNYTAFYASTDLIYMQ